MNKAGTQNIETKRLLLRRFKIEDAEDMYNNRELPVLRRGREIMNKEKVEQ